MSAAALYSSSSPMAILLLFLLVTLSASSPSSSPPPSGCSSELVRFSQCLPYVASPPNNLSHAPPSKCCEAFSSAVESGTAVCLCYLLENPAMLGFPVSGDRVISLSSLCPLNASTSLDSICSGTQQLPPLRNTTTTPVIPSPNSHGSSDLRNTSIPVISRPLPPPPGPESASSTSNGTVPEATKNSNSEPVGVSSAIVNNNTSWFLPAVAIILLI